MPPTNQSTPTVHTVHAAAVVRDYISQPRISKNFKISSFILFTFIFIILFVHQQLSI